MNQQEIINYANNNKWKKIGNWNSSVLLIELSISSLVKRYLSVIDINLDIEHFLCIDKDMYYSEEFYDKLVNFFYNKISKDHQYLESLHKKLDKISCETLKDIDSVKKIDEFINVVSKVTSLGCAIIPLDYAIKKYMVDNKIDPEITQYVYPIRKAYMIKEKIDLLKIKLKSQQQDITNDIIDHRKKYGWMNTVNWYFDQFDVKYYKKRIKEINLKKAKDELIQLEKTDSEEIINNYLQNQPKQYSGILKDLRLLMDAKALNWDVVGISNNALREIIADDPILKNTDYQVIVSLTTKEIKDLIQGALSKKEATRLYNQRKKGKIMLLNKDCMEVYPLDDILTKMNLGNPIVDDKHLTGEISYQGKVIGNIKKVFSAGECNLFKQGEILVCPMTNPDFMPAVTKASAIITDEGGMLCHAAIVARELKIPCITGTKIATKILKDGDLVEVDANQGFVKIITN